MFLSITGYSSNAKVIMQNDPTLDPKYLGKISADFVKVAEQLKEAAYQIRKRNFSEYPIFPISKEDIPIGQLLYEKGKMTNEWNYYASFLEEFEQRELVAEKEAFKQAYKDADEFCCLFIVDREFTNFVFIPYPVD
ncbi:hypothetical protein [Marinoscillum furvescens]|uniref:Uncharacterized protein n=1 Tax=Marinoscillum furvescens DSM 4134 TaxID=1122208 RepID=A0A3D9KYU7_MARFU|nr:hypothetical protein [Marinoscillum furvescens]RED91742.1 hypothetical protein C7460_13712 [Marinoscillum furvescens DSM 4134]